MRRWYATAPARPSLPGSLDGVGCPGGRAAGGRRRRLADVQGRRLITLDKVDSLKPFLPPEFWSNRDFFFYEGRQLEIGPFFRDYQAAPEYRAATGRFKGEARVGPESSLESCTAGQPFAMEEIDCLGDPRAGEKIIWHNHRWSEDDPDYYPGWKGVPTPSDLRVVSDTIINVQTGTGNRIEFWDSHGAPLKSRGRIRHYIDVGRLTGGH